MKRKVESNQETTISSLPAELLFLIFLNLIPEDLKILTVSKFFQDTLQISQLWKAKTKKHLPQTNISSPKEFFEAYNKRYPQLSPSDKKLISIIRECDFYHLNQCKIDLFVLDIQLDDNFDLLRLVQKTSNPTLFNYFYKLALKKYELEMRSGRPILYWAVELHQDLNQIKRLLEQNRNMETSLLNQRYLDQGAHLIHLAAKNGLLDIVDFLIEADPSLLETVDHQQNTPIIWAAIYDQRNIVDFLIVKKANINVLTQAPNDTDHGKSALDHAICRGFSDIAIKLIKSGAIPTNTIGDMLFQPIHVAAQNGLLEVVTELIETYPELLETPDACHQTPLLWAVAQNHEAVANYLLRKKAKPNVVTQSPNQDNGKSILYWAVNCTSSQLIKKLLQAGAKDSAQGPYSIHLAITENRLEVATLLLDANPALLEQRDQEGFTPLGLAAINNNEVIMDYLIERHANINDLWVDPNQIDQEVTLLYRLIEKYPDSSIGIMKLIQKGATLGNKPFYPIHMAVNHGLLGLVECLIEQNLQWLNQLDGKGKTPLFLAMKNKDPYIVNYLIQKGALLFIDEKARLPSHSQGFFKINFSDTAKDALCGVKSFVERIFQ